jgi:hypothetical protein
VLSVLEMWGCPGVRGKGASPEGKLSTADCKEEERGDLTGEACQHEIDAQLRSYLGKRSITLRLRTTLTVDSEAALLATAPPIACSNNTNQHTETSSIHLASHEYDDANAYDVLCCCAKSLSCSFSEHMTIFLDW